MGSHSSEQKDRVQAAPFKGEGLYYERVLSYFHTLAKPPGSLGEIEILAARVSEAQQAFPPVYANPSIVIFAADHGVAQEESVSPYPWHVTKAMVNTFSKAKAAISVIARAQGAQLEIVNCGVEGLKTPECVTGVRFFDAEISAKATKNFVYSDAMTKAQCEKAIEAGRTSLIRQLNFGSTLLAAGEMGIGNTTAATAICSHLMGVAPIHLVGPGTGLNTEGVARKTRVIEKALNRLSNTDPVSTLMAVGGFEIAALVGFYLEANQKNVPVLLDGFICSAAALVALKIDPSVRRILIPSSLSGEPNHYKILNELKLGPPLLQLQMRLGEGSAAALALSLVQSSILLLNEMALLSDVLEEKI